MKKDHGYIAHLTLDSSKSILEAVYRYSRLKLAEGGVYMYSNAVYW